MSRYERICGFWRHHTQTARTKRQHRSSNVGRLRPCWPHVAAVPAHSACVPPGAMPRTSYGLAQGPFAPWGIPVTGSTEIVPCRHLAGGLSGNRIAGALSARRRWLRTTAPSFINASPWQSISSPLAHAHDHAQGTCSSAHLARILAIFTISPPRGCSQPTPRGLFPCFHAVSIGVFWMETAEPQQIRGLPPLCFHVSV
jgi:hypothetical protein